MDLPSPEYFTFGDFDLWIKPSLHNNFSKIVEKEPKNCLTNIDIQHHGLLRFEL